MELQRAGHDLRATVPVEVRAVDRDEMRLVGLDLPRSEGLLSVVLQPDEAGMTGAVPVVEHADEDYVRIAVPIKVSRRRGIGPPRFEIRWLVKAQGVGLVPTALFSSQKQP